MNSKSAPEINAGSMADIAFLLLVFFLVTTTMDSDLGLLRKLSQIQENTPQIIVHKTNVLPIWVNSYDRIMLNGKPIEISELKEITKEFIANPNNRMDMPEKKMIQVPLFGEVGVSKQVVSLKSDAKTSYGAYIQVQNEIAKAYNELRNEISEEKFGVSYSHLKETNQIQKIASIKMIYPQRISEAEPNTPELANN